MRLRFKRSQDSSRHRPEQEPAALTGKALPGSIARILPALLLPALLFGWADWRVTTSKNFRFIYKPAFESSAVKALHEMEQYRDFVVRLTGNNMRQAPFVIEDIGTMANGYTDLMFDNIHLFTYPPEPWSEIGFGTNYWRMLGVHEYIHLGSMTNAGGLPGILVWLFGPYLRPNVLFLPTWVLEGITVYGESRVSPFEGRLNDGYFDAYMAARIADRRFPTLADMTYLPAEYPYFSQPYLYGGTFFGYIGEKYGRDKFGQMFGKTGECCGTYCTPCTPCLGLDLAGARAFGSPSFSRLHSEWELSEATRHQKWRIDGERLTRTGGTVGFLTASGSDLYYCRSRVVKTGAGLAFSLSDIVRRDISSGREQTVVRLNSDVTCPPRIREGRLYYAVLDAAPGFANTYVLGYGFISELHIRDLISGNDRVLLRDRIRAFCVLDDGEIVFSRDQRFEFGSELLALKPGETRPRILFTTPELVGELAAEGSRIAAVTRRNPGSWDIAEVLLDQQCLKPVVVTPWKESNLAFAGDKLLFCANYDRVYSCFTWDFEAGSAGRLTTGGFSAFPALTLPGNDLYFAGLTSYGNDLFRKRDVKAEPFDLPTGGDIDSGAPEPWHGPLRRHGYSGILPTLVPVIHTPMISTNADFTSIALGAELGGMDATGEHLYDVMFSVPVDVKGRKLKVPTLDLTYQTLFFSPFNALLLFSNDPLLADLTVQYPLRYRPASWLNTVFCGLQVSLFDGKLARKTLTPQIGAGLSPWPGNRAALSVAFTGEHKSLGSSRSCALFELSGQMRQYLGRSELGVGLTGLLSSETLAITPFEGYGFILDSSYGTLGSKHGLLGHAGYSFPILKIRQGLWNPSVYFEDICGALVVEGAWNLGKTAYAFVAAEAKFELGVLGSLMGPGRIIPTLGVGISERLKPLAYFKFDVGAWSDLGLKPMNRVADALSGKAKVVQRTSMFGHASRRRTG